MNDTTKHRHFKLGTKPEPMRITQRDIAIGLHLARHRYLDADQICRLVEDSAGGSHQRTRVRLTKLFRNEYIGRPRQREHHERHGRSDYVYGLKNRMARVLPESELPQGRIEWTKRTTTVTDRTLRHTLETSELLVTFETSAKKYPNTELRHLEALFAELPPKSQALENPWFVAAHPRGFPAKAKGMLKPDAIFSVRQTAPSGPRDLFFVAEVDCNTMPITRGAKEEAAMKRAVVALGEAAKDRETAERQVSDARYRLLLRNLTSNQRSVLQKFVRYFHAYKQDWFKEHFGWPAARILFTTTDASHRDRMIDALQYVTAGQAPNLFLFSTHDEIRGCDDIFRHEWKNGVGEPTTLISK